MSPAADDSRHPVPTAAAQRESQQNIRALFSRAYAGRSPQDFYARATQFLKIGIETENAPADQYVLLEEALEAAISIGDVDTTLKTHAALAERFRIDANEHFAATSKSLIPKISSVATATPLFQAYQAQISLLIASDEYNHAIRLLDDIAPLAKKVRAGPLWIEHFDQESERVADLNRKYASVTSEFPRDPNGHEPSQISAQHAEALGRFYCFEKGDWDKGLPYLAKARDKKLKQLATLELSTPTSDEQWLALAEGWVESRSSSAAKRHAREIYQRLLVTTTGIQQAKIMKKLSEIGEGRISAGFDQYLERPFALNSIKADGAPDLINSIVFKRDGTYIVSWNPGSLGGHWYFDGAIIYGILGTSPKRFSQFSISPGGIISGKTFIDNTLYSIHTGYLK
ncbi:hypothetical protein SH528x_005902 [Novipirellula sp. SH528]|uniref:hypothetical protein n=1 Tax=Novipirellula sp. SH528 TaxID=3454466 RepID=UPI003FA09360